MKDRSKQEAWRLPHPTSSSDASRPRGCESFSSRRPWSPPAIVAAVPHVLCTIKLATWRAQSLPLPRSAPVNDVCLHQARVALVPTDLAPRWWNRLGRTPRDGTAHAAARSTSCLSLSEADAIRGRQPCVQCVSWRSIQVGSFRPSFRFAPQS